MKRFADHHTNAAPWSRLLGSIGLTLAVASLAAKRFGLVDADVFILSFAAATLIGLAAILAALIAFQRIWTLGGSGLGSALAGTLFGGLALVLPVGLMGAVVLQPELQDISTDLADPPKLTVDETASDQPVTEWVNATVAAVSHGLILPDAQGPEAETAVQTALYPDIVSRRYRIPPGRLHSVGFKAVDNLNWRVVDELPPDLLDAQTRLQVEARTLVMNLVHDVAIRIRPDPVGALLDIRSRSRTPLRDYSGNADHIRKLLAEIDLVLVETYGDQARLSVEDDDLEDDTLQEPIEPDQDLIPLPEFKPYFESEDSPAADELEG